MKIPKKLLDIARHLHIIQAIYFIHYPKYRQACREYIPKLTADEERKKRILIVAPYMSMGGAEKVVLDLASNINREKYVVDIISVTNNPDGSNIWKQLYTEAADHLWHIPDIIHRAYRAGFLYHIVQDRKYDIIIMSHASVYINTLTPILRKFPFSKKYCIIHGLLPDWSFEVANYDFFWDKYICVCTHAAELLTKLKGIPAAKIEVIHNGVDTNYFNPSLFTIQVYRDKFKINNNDKLVAFVGRMTSEKHPEYVIQIARLMKDYSFIRFAIAGDGPMLGDIKQMVKTEGLHDNVFILGYVDNIPQLLSEIDLLYLCSETEAFGLCILEAMAMGKPAVVSNVGGISEFFEDGINGLMINFDNNFAENSKKAILSIFLEQNKDKYKLINRQKAETLSIKNQLIQYEALFR